MADASGVSPADLVGYLAHHEYYEDVAGQQLADEFYTELRSFFQKAADAPEAFSIRQRDLRRVNLERFPSLSFLLSHRRRARPHIGCATPPQTPDAGTESTVGYKYSAPPALIDSY